MRVHGFWGWLPCTAPLVRAGHGQVRAQQKGLPGSTGFVLFPTSHLRCRAYEDIPSMGPWGQAEGLSEPSLLLERCLEKEGKPIGAAEHPVDCSQRDPRQLRNSLRGTAVGSLLLQPALCFGGSVRPPLPSLPFLFLP